MDSIQRCQQVIRTCGVELSDGSLPVLHKPSALFRYQLSEAIRNDTDLVEFIGTYLDELLSDHDAISLYLDPMTPASVATNDDDDNTSAAQIQQQAGMPQTDSLVRLMLGVDALQSRLIATLLDKFPEYIGDEGDVGTTKVSVKILRQLRWLDYVLDSAGLTEKLLETLGFVPPDMQREIVAALPDIISDSDTNEVSKVLAGMLSETPELMLSILETLGSLDCAPALLQEARNSVIAHLVSAEPIELPVMMRFLLQSVSAEAAKPTILRIRKRLDLDSIVMASRQQQQQQKSKAREDQTPDVLIFDAIATSLRSHKHLRDAWLKLIADDTDEVGPQTTLDIVVLLILHQITTHTKRVESVLKGKIDAVSSRPVAFTPAVFESVIARFPAVFSVHFSALLAVASWLIQTSALGSQGSRVASSITVAAFGAMGMFQRQEISGELAVHIGSGNVNEVDTATHIYLELARRHPYELRPFAVFIKGLLDYVDNLGIAHVRTIFDTLGILSTLSSGSGGGADDSMFSDLFIFVRKQLASVYPKYNRIGVVGTVSLLRQLGSERSADPAGHDGAAEAGSSTAPQEPRANIQALRRAVQLLEMLVDSGRHQSWTFISMTYDELAHIVETRGLHSQLLTWLHENVSSSFAAQFLGDVEDLGRRYLLTGAPSVALSLDDEEAAVLDVFNHNADAEHSGLHAATKRADSGGAEDDCDAPRLRGSMLSCLPALLRLIQVCEKALGDGSLGEIDALLVCGIYLLPPIDIASPESPVPSQQQYTMASSDDASGNASLMLAGNALVGLDEDSRTDLIKAICRWPLDLRRALCTSLYVAVNWIREVINAFADQRGDEARSKVVQRVNQLSHIEGGLEALALSLSGTANEFQPAAAGLIPEMTDTPAARMAVNNGQALRIQGPPDAAEPMDESSGHLRSSEHNGLFMVDVGELLLSQEDTRKLVSGDSVDPQHQLDDEPTVSKKRGRKRKSAGLGSAAPTGEDFAKNMHPFLRELSFSAFNILQINAHDDDDDDDGDETRGQTMLLLSAHGLRVILRELHAAVGSKLVRRAERRLPWAKQSSAAGFGVLATFSSNISGSTASGVFASLMPIFPSLLRYLDGCLAIRARYRNDVDSMEQEDSQPVRVVAVDTLNDVIVIEECVDLLLQIVSSVLSWDGLQAEQEEGHSRGHRTALTAVLGALAQQGQHTDPDELESIDPCVLVRRAFDYLQRVSQMVATSNRAIDILRMLTVVRGFAPTSELPDEVRCMGKEQRDSTMDGQISVFARRVLDARWAATQEIKPVDLEYLVLQHITRSPHDRLELAYAYSTRMLPNALEGVSFGNDGDDDSSDESLATLKRATFASAYKAVNNALAVVVRATPLSDMSGSELVHFAGLVADSWAGLTRLTQTVDSSLQRSTLHLALRGGFTMTDIFIKAIFPRLDSCFFTHRDEVLAVLARMQKATRVVHSICNHSKASKDTRLQAAVPQTKRRLEQLLFQVYVLMGNNESINALKMGNLKHRGVRGETVSSQIPRDELMSDEDDEDEEHDEVEEEAEEEEDVEMESASDENNEPIARPPVQVKRARGGKSAGTRSKVGKRIEVLQRKKLLAQRRKSAGQ
ncbi:Fanconi anemia group D2 protein [Coemansia erecta]|nr:Fanconi anemia group D2 protein [Coemansia erecta]